MQILKDPQFPKQKHYYNLEVGYLHCNLFFLKHFIYQLLLSPIKLSIHYCLHSLCNNQHSFQTNQQSITPFHISNLKLEPQEVQFLNLKIIFLQNWILQIRATITYYCQYLYQISILLLLYQFQRHQLFMHFSFVWYYL